MPDKIELSFKEKMELLAFAETLSDGMPDLMTNYTDLLNLIQEDAEVAK